MSGFNDQRGAKGFTLVELLAVAALLALLLLVAGGALQTVRRQSQAAVCLSHLRSLGAAVLAHAADHNAILLSRKNEDTRWTVILARGGYLSPQAIESGLLVCPAGPPSQSNTECYGMRMWGSHEARMLVPADAPLPLRFIKEPSQFFILADSLKTGAGRATQWYAIQSKGKSNAVHLRHGNKAHALFADGRVAAADRDYFENCHVPEVNLLRPKDAPDIIGDEP